MTTYSDDTKDLVKKLYIRRVQVSDIERETKVPRRTIYSWIEKYGWDSLIHKDEVLDALNRRLVTILEKKDLSDGDLNAIERLMAARAKEMKIRAMPEPEGSASVILDGAHQRQQSLPLDAQRVADGKHEARQGKRGKNDFRGISAEEVEAKFKEGLFGYQVDLWKKRHKRVRNILKSRQIGMTFYFAREAFADALISGKNQAFLSASKAQAQLFRSYIQSFALEWFGVELKGADKNIIRTDHGDVVLYYLSTNSSTSQGPTGNVYIDECFWVPKFKKLKDLAGAIASHEHWRKTYFSTPSTKSHDAYALWSGEEYKRNQKKRPELTPFVMPSAKQLKAGVDCVDGQYRQVITIHDAMANGCNLFNIKYLELENDPDTFAQLYECKFIDDTNSAFRLEDLLACAVADVRWPDFKPDNERPFGSRAVWIGYDPARNRDSAEISVLAVPLKAGGKFRLLEKITLQNQSWTYQADVIKGLTERYNVQHIGIDCTGPGSGVFERVQEFYPAAMAIHYSVDIKTRLVLKAQDILRSGRLEYDIKHTEIPSAFMAIRKVSTGTSITYVASRDQNIGHADAAWSIMHALIAEGLNTAGDSSGTYVLSD